MISRIIGVLIILRLVSFIHRVGHTISTLIAKQSLCGTFGVSRFSNGWLPITKSVRWSGGDEEGEGESG